jgi:hypothetical protein
LLKKRPKGKERRRKSWRNRLKMQKRDSWHSKRKKKEEEESNSKLFL